MWGLTGRCPYRRLGRGAAQANIFSKGTLAAVLRTGFRDSGDKQEDLLRGCCNSPGRS